MRTLEAPHRVPRRSPVGARELARGGRAMRGRERAALRTATPSSRSAARAVHPRLGAEPEHVLERDNVRRSPRTPARRGSCPSGSPGRRSRGSEAPPRARASVCARACACSSRRPGRGTSRRWCRCRACPCRRRRGAGSCAGGTSGAEGSSPKANCRILIPGRPKRSRRANTAGVTAPRSSAMSGSVAERRLHRRRRSRRPAPSSSALHRGRLVGRDRASSAGSR